MTVAFKELSGSPSETFAPEGMAARRRIVVAWEDRFSMLVELLGSGGSFGGAPPAGYPACPYALVMRATMEPWPPTPDAQGAFNAVASQLNGYSGKYALIEIDYEMLETDPGRDDLPQPASGTFLTYRMSARAEYIALSGQTMHWASDSSVPVPPDAVGAVRIPVIEHRITWHRATNPPWAAIRQCVGSVNDAAFLGAIAETVLFDGASAQRQFVRLNPLQQPEYGWRIDYTFLERAIRVAGATYGWNHRYRCLPQNNPGWDVLLDGNQNSLYSTANLATLFQFAAS